MSQRRAAAGSGPCGPTYHPHTGGIGQCVKTEKVSLLPQNAYEQFAANGLIKWETAQNISDIKASAVQKNSTPSLTQTQAVALLNAIPADTLQGMRDLAKRLHPDRLPGDGLANLTAFARGHRDAEIWMYVIVAVRLREVHPTAGK